MALILVIDDEPAIRMLIAEVLAEHGYDAESIARLKARGVVATPEE